MIRYLAVMLLGEVTKLSYVLTVRYISCNGLIWIYPKALQVGSRQRRGKPHLRHFPELTQLPQLRDNQLRQ